eukprot:NODE_548_length_6182_cov_1.284564.p5 type:complete len:172 gc:universal NODE_548_length_6182_cov_1.284564:3541-4056(+)
MFISSVFAFQATVTIKGSPWKRGQNDSAASFEWLAGNTPVALPAGFPESLDLYLTDESKKQVMQITIGDPSKFARWIFSGNYTVPNVPDGKYYIELVNSKDTTDVAFSSSMVEIKGGSPLANTTTTNTTNTTNSSSSDNSTQTGNNSNKKAVSSSSAISIALLSLMSFVFA